MSKLQETSEDIILKAIHGDEDAFSQIYRTYSNRVYFMAIQYFRNEDTAKDIVQEVFIKVYRQINKLQAPKAFSSWLHVITYRECHNYNRRKSNIFELGDEDKIEDFPNTAEVDVISKIENERIKNEIMDILDDLSIPLKSVAMLRFFEDLKLQEIADILDIPKNTVSSRLIRIRRVLSTELQKKGINSTYGVIVVSPVVLFEAYKMLYQQTKMNQALSNDILYAILPAGADIAGGISLLSKWIIGVVTTGVVFGGIALWNTQPQQEEEKKPKVEEVEEVSKPSKEPELAEITSISYDDAWRNQPIQLAIETSNDNYERITINDIETTQVVNNGTYMVKLIKDDAVIDEEVIQISNVDLHSPTATSEKDDEYYYLYLSDDKSGVNANQITYYVNGTASNDYTYDASRNVMIVKNDNVSRHDIYISDYAGNILTIEIE
ncbi:RNA polymerase sigma factor [Breznakia pachnodae]|uniref:RNA polymerase sigma factor (Sigma-70 family) n=1 Tax=Breznakia pachnodae TaxID=265178 RepID=A0ABU0E0D5_9FIRM|nr:RNA polymerase sigma factor [Breznakia pachnodae]MDQ0360325.1 RNA polymerase sigma factor (sigma-70 family) [Breznakia pachnodae]